MARIRADLALTIAAATLIGLGAQTLTTKAIERNNRPAEYMAVEITDGTVGAQAQEDTPRAQSLAEIRTQQGLFTVAVDDIRDYAEIRDDFYSLVLPTGEAVVARVLKDSIVREENEERSSAYYTEWRYVMPIGQLVLEPVPDKVLERVGGYRGIVLDDSSFYIDMRGTHKGGVQYTPTDAKAVGEAVFGITTAILIVVFWQIGTRVGLFPYLFPRRQRPGAFEA